MTVATSRAIGAYYTAEGSLVSLPAAWKGDGTVPGVIYLHGATQTELQVLDYAAYPGLTNIIKAVAAAGWPVLGVYAGGDKWGNATGLARVSDAKTYLQGTIGAKAGTVALIGGSMGGLTALNWAKANLASVSCVVGLVPVSDVSDIVTNNRGGLAASVNTAYSTWNEGTMGATYNPHTYAATGLTGLHYKAWTGSADTIVIPSTVTDVVTAIGATASSVATTGDHNTTNNLIPPADVVSFIQAYNS